MRDVFYILALNTREWWIMSGKIHGGVRIHLKTVITANPDGAERFGGEERTKADTNAHARRDRTSIGCRRARASSILFFFFIDRKTPREREPDTLVKKKLRASSAYLGRKEKKIREYHASVNLRAVDFRNVKLRKFSRIE